MPVINANFSGIQAQQATDAFKSMVRATKPYVLKIIDGARDEALVAQWIKDRNDMGGGILVLRYRPPYEDTIKLSDMDRACNESLQIFNGWQRFASDKIMVIMEVPFNEKFHTDKRDFAALAVASVAVGARFKEAGYTPGVLIISEGNPPGDSYGIDYFLQPTVLYAMRAFRRQGAVWCPHGYSHPDHPADDEYHFARPKHILDLLPADAQINYLFGEMGCDGGCDFAVRKPGVGWTGYFPEIKKYADWVRPQTFFIAADTRCLGGAFFLSGAQQNGNPNFDSFDIKDEVDFRSVLTEFIPGQARVRLDGRNITTGGTGTVPSVNGYTVGQGVADKLKAQKDKAVSDEHYIGDFMSVTFGEKGMYVYSKEANKTYFLEAQ